MISQLPEDRIALKKILDNSDSTDKSKFALYSHIG
jgi:hypothetical protein